MTTAAPATAADVPALESLAALLRAMGDPLRLVILRVLARDSFGVLELCQLLDMKQPALSHHLKVLAQAGLLSTRRERTTVYYRRNSQAQATGSLSQRALDELDALPLPAAVLARLQAVQEARSQASLAFFSSHAARFASQQELIAAFGEYGNASAERAAALAPAQATVLEIGPGTGELLPLLSPRFKRVIGLDNSSEMLAKAALRSGELANVELVSGDTATARSKGLRPDVVIMNMVLHHVPEPTGVMNDIAALLPSGGGLVMTELCEHEQDWAREACGDVWLGFAPEALTGWAAAAGLREGSADYLALKNGFRIQIREFVKN
jgi:ArsR family transcriptional regulator